MTRSPADLLRPGQPLTFANVADGAEGLVLSDLARAIANRCAHMACPLEGGACEAFLITCPCHDWRFDVRTGAFVDAPEIAIPTYPVRVTDGEVFVSL